KWRLRNEKSTGPFLDKYLTHPYTQWIRYYHYMYLMTGEEWYRAEALRKAQVINRQMIEVNDSTAMIWVTVN
ncbi:MAG: hypothetical protein SCH72_14810, partial [Desulfuromonadales bacterium]|nr:hypothetical protein [Desulfuromonadales bacterium]